MTTLNPPEDIELAEELLKIHKWAGSVKFCRTGGESMSIAARLRYIQKKIKFYLWLSRLHDWYLSANLFKKIK